MAPAAMYHQLMNVKHMGENKKLAVYSTLPKSHI